MKLCILCSWFILWRPVLATVRFRQRIGHELEQRRVKGYANDNMSSHLMDGIGSKEKKLTATKIVYMRGENHASHKRTSSPARMMAEAFRRSRHRPQQADFHWIGTSEEACAGRGNMRCKACNDRRLKPVHERSELCGEGLSA